MPLQHPYFKRQRTRLSPEDRNDDPPIGPRVEISQIVIALGVAAVDEEALGMISGFDDFAEWRECLVRQRLDLQGQEIRHWHGTSDKR